MSPKDSDSADTMYLLTLAVRIGPPAMFIMLAIEYAFFHGRFIIFILPDLAATALLVLAAKWMLDRLGAAAGSILLPSGKSTPVARQYSEQESLIIRGHFAEAADSFRAIVQDDPRNIEAHMRLAALLARDGNDTTEAEYWFRAVRRLGPTPQQDLAASNELIALYQSNGDTAKVVAELNRLARQYRDSAIGEKARERLDSLVPPVAETPS